MSVKPAHNLHNKRWRSEDIRAEENISFSTLLLSERILKGLKRAGFRKPSPVQLKAIPLGRCGVDLIVQAKSGTGKTCVFSVVALEGLADIPNLQVLILAPTREVAHQICGVINSIGSTISNLTCQMFIGGTPVIDDVQKAKNCQIAVGTPGRVKQLIQMKALMTGCIRLFVLDEADRLISEHFLEEINWIYNHLPVRKQVLAASATYPKSLMTLLKGYMRNPAVICVNEKELALRGLLQFYCVTEGHPLPHVTYQKKRDLIWEIVNKVSFSQCLIFCNTIARVELLSEWLNSQGYPTAKISSSDDQSTRLKTIEELKTFQCRILVTSDLTARGIDAENVDFVINADLASNLETYLHRIGRAGRYGTKATAVTIITTGFEEQKLGEFEKDGNFKVYPLPDPIPDNLLAWTVEMVKSAKIEESKHPIEELEKISFTGSSDTKDKNIHVSNDDLGSDSSSDVSDDKNIDKEKNPVLSSGETCLKGDSQDKPASESLAENDNSSNLNGSVVETYDSDSSVSKLLITEQENGMLLQCESPVNRSESLSAAHPGSFDSVESSVKDYDPQCKASMCNSDVISASSLMTDSELNTKAGGLASDSKDINPEDENFSPCASDSCTAELDDYGMVLTSERSIQKTEDNDLKTGTCDLIDTSEVDDSMFNSEAPPSDFMENGATINENSMFDVKKTCTEMQNQAPNVNESDKERENSDIVQLEETSHRKSNVNALPCGSCDPVGDSTTLYETCTNNSGTVYKNNKASNCEESILDLTRISLAHFTYNNENSRETNHKNSNSSVAELKDSEKCDSFVLGNRVDGCSNNYLNKYVENESVTPHNIVASHPDKQKHSQVDDSNNTLRDNIDKFLFSCCAEENCKGRAFSSLTNLSASYFDSDREKFEACEKTLEQVVEILEANRGDLETLAAEKSSSDFKSFSTEDLSLIQSYLHGTKSEYLSPIRELAALIDVNTGTNKNNKHHVNRIEKIDVVHDMPNTSEEVKSDIDQMENTEKGGIHMPEPSELNSSNIITIEKGANEVSKLISDVKAHEVKQQAVCGQNNKSENICDMNPIKSDLGNTEEAKLRSSSNVQSASISSSSDADSKVEEPGESSGFPFNMSKVVDQTATKKDFPLDRKVKKESGVKVHNQKLSVKPTNAKKLCVTNQNKHERDNQKDTYSKTFQKDYQRHTHKQPKDKKFVNERPVPNRKVYERETVNRSTEHPKLKIKKENKHSSLKESKPAVVHARENESKHYQRRYPCNLNLAESQVPCQYSNFITDIPISNSWMNDDHHCSYKGQKYMASYGQGKKHKHYQRYQHKLPCAEYDVPCYQYAKCYGNKHVGGSCVNAWDPNHSVCSVNHSSDYAAYNHSGCCVHSRFHSPVMESCCHSSIGCNKDYYPVDSDIALPCAVLNAVYGGGPSLFFCGEYHDLGRDLHEDLLTLID